VGEPGRHRAQGDEPRLELAHALVDLRALHGHPHGLAQHAGAAPHELPEEVGRQAQQGRGLERRARRGVGLLEDEDELGEDLARAERHGVHLAPAHLARPLHSPREDDAEPVGRVALPRDDDPRVQAPQLAALLEPREPLVAERREERDGAQVLGEGRHRLDGLRAARG